MPDFDPTRADWFWERVSKGDGCWQWSRGKNRNGYGVVRGKSRQLKSHRVAYELSVGPIPDGMCVLHRCDNPACCRPDHLFLGTVDDNNKDKKSKGRGKVNKGERNGMSRLTDSDVLAIRERYAAGGIFHSQLAAEYGVTSSLICNIIKGRRWSHVGGERRHRKSRK